MPPALVPGDPPEVKQERVEGDGDDDDDDEEEDVHDRFLLEKVKSMPLVGNLNFLAPAEDYFYKLNDYIILHPEFQHMTSELLSRMTPGWSRF